MIHPVITKIFPNKDESTLIFSWICSKINRIEQLEEFIKWHVDLNKEVVKEIALVREMDFSKEANVKKWAKNYLETYEEKIRKMRHVSNLVFSRFHRLMNGELKKIILENKNQEQKITSMMGVFLNKKELLIGKMIFAYRETWFLANHIHYPGFKLGTIEQYKKWTDENIANLKEIGEDLENMQKEIAKWKE